MAGLNAAYQLKKRGYDSTVYESRSRVGGRMFTVRDAFGPGSVTDVGGELVNTNHSDIIGLAQEFGIGLFDRSTDAAATGLPIDSYLIDGRVVLDAEVARGLRALARRIGRDAAKLDADPDRYTPIFDDLSAKAYLDQNADLIPAPWVRELIEESVRTEYGVEPEGASSLVFLYNLPTVNGQEVEMLSGSDERYLIEGGSSPSRKPSPPASARPYAPASLAAASRVGTMVTASPSPTARGPRPTSSSARCRGRFSAALTCRSRFPPSSGVSSTRSSSARTRR